MTRSSCGTIFPCIPKRPLNDVTSVTARVSTLTTTNSKDCDTLPPITPSNPSNRMYPFSVNAMVRGSIGTYLNVETDPSDSLTERTAVFFSSATYRKFPSADRTKSRGRLNCASVAAPSMKPPAYNIDHHTSLSAYRSRGGSKTSTIFQSSTE